MTLLAKNLYPLSIALLGWSSLLYPALAQKPQQPTLGHRSVKTLTQNGLTFKDLNKNGKLDRYEDWRLPVESRVQDLISQMTLEEKVGFMLISTTRMAGDNAFKPNAPKAEITSGFNEEDLVQPNNMFTRKPLSVPIMSAAGTTKGVKQYHLRHFILRANPSARIIAEWANNLQTLCEASRLAIPAIVASNPRNHVTIDAAVGLSVGKRRNNCVLEMARRVGFSRYARFETDSRICRYCPPRVGSRRLA